VIFKIILTMERDSISNALMFWRERGPVGVELARRARAHVAQQLVPGDRSADSRRGPGAARCLGDIPGQRAGQIRLVRPPVEEVAAKRQRAAGVDQRGGFVERRSGGSHQNGGRSHGVALAVQKRKTARLQRHAP